MAKSDDSLLKSLAMAFGDGLAFGVGMKVVQVTHKSGARMTSGVSHRIEPAGNPSVFASPDQQILEQITAALEARLSEQMSHVERRFAEAEARIALELRAVENRAGENAARLAGDGVARDWDALEERLRAECNSYVEKRIQAVEEKLRNEISLAGTRTAGMLVQMIEKKVLDRIGEVEQSMIRQSGALRSLHEKSGEAERHFQELIAGFARLCQEAQTPLPETPPAEDENHVGGGGSAEEPTTCHFATLEETGRTARNWRVPLVSFFIAAAGLAVLFSPRF